MLQRVISKTQYRQNMKTISIITTLYNAPIEGLRATLNSVLRQNYPGLVHYLYNDGSKDRSFVDVVNQYIEDVKKLDKPFIVKFIDCKENLGVDKAHFKCFEMVTTDYFMWLDCSDYLENNFFNKVSDFLDNHFEDYQFYHFNSYEFCGATIKKEPTSSSFSRDALKQKKQFNNFLSKKNWFYHSFLINTEVYRKINPLFMFVNRNRHGGFFYDGQIIWALCLADYNFYFFDNVYSYIEKPLSSVSTGYKYDHELIHEVMMELLFSFDFENKFERAKQTMAFFDNRSVYKKLISMDRQMFKNELLRILPYYRDKELSQILFPKKQINKLLIVSRNPLLYKYFLKKHRKEIENRLYFY